MFKKLSTFLLILCLGASSACISATQISVAGLVLDIKDFGFISGSLIEIYIPQIVRNSINSSTDQDTQFKTFKAWEAVNSAVNDTLLPILENGKPTSGNVQSWFDMVIGKNGTNPIGSMGVNGIKLFLDVLYALVPVQNLDKAFDSSPVAQDIRIVLIATFQMFADKVGETLTSISNEKPNVFTVSKFKKQALKKVSLIPLECAIMQNVKDSSKSLKISKAENPQNISYQDGDIILYESDGGFLGKAVEMFSGYPYVHCLMFLDNYWYEYDVHGCRKVPTWPYDTGLVTVRYTGTLTVDQKVQMKQWWESRIGSHERYGIELLINLMLIKVGQIESVWAQKLENQDFIPWVKRTKWGAMLEECSSSISESYKAAGIKLFDFDPSWTSPGDFLKSKVLVKIQ